MDSRSLPGQAAVAEQELARQLPPAAMPETSAEASISVSAPWAVELQPSLPLQGLGLMCQPQRLAQQLPCWLLAVLTEQLMQTPGFPSKLAAATAAEKSSTLLHDQQPANINCTGMVMAQLC